MKKSLMVLFLFTSFLINSYAIADGMLSENLLIESKILGYELQYRVYVPESAQPGDELPTLYITDGQWYISRGELPALMDKQIADGNIEPAIVVFVDSRNPDKLSDNRRNRQFFCLKGYADFFTSELVAEIDANYPTSANRNDRVILGLSFGAYNSGCFGLMANETFAGIAMQSPANSPMVNEMSVRYQSTDKLPIKIFLSVGTIRDNTRAGQNFKSILTAKGYDITYKEVAQTHDWENWKPLLDDVLLTFFAR